MLHVMADLERFVAAQAPIYGTVRAELAAGAKHTHWIWFIFPQIAGLGASALSRIYAISGRAEAQAYLAHPILGARLAECTTLMLGHDGMAAAEILGGIDAIKFRSCMTLFAAIADNPLFQAALDKYFEGAPDPETLARLEG
jgi:uncharacterized protein (DUF1810 family)